MARKKGGGGGGGGGAPEWMVTFSDMVTLLLCFFILLYSMSSLDNQKLVGLMNSMTETFNPRSREVNPTPTGPIDRPDVVGSAAVIPSSEVLRPVVPAGDPRASKRGRSSTLSRLEESLDQIAREVKKAAVQFKVEHQMKAVMADRGLVIGFSEALGGHQSVAMFESGSARLRPEFQQVLDALAPAFQLATTKIEVQGHTDRRPISTAVFPSNWELSAARAGSVVRYLTVRHGLPARQFVCTGLADTMPADTRDTPEGWAENRRIEIVITRHPIDGYDQVTRATAAASTTDITQPITKPIGDDLVPKRLPDTRPLEPKPEN